MPSSSLLTLIDDVASVLDDVATMTKVATKRTAGILGDDLAVNAEQVSGVRAERELPVVWAVARGSALNKVVLVPAALAVSAVLPGAIAPLLMAGGAYLCYEGVEKVLHKVWPGAHDAADHARRHALADPAVDAVAFEREKIRGAIRTDFILSAEIIVIALGTVMEAALVTRVATLVAISAIMTVGVYGLVAAIVKLDDAGLYLVERGGRASGLGHAIVAASPWLMRGLGIAGTVAMFLVGGGIIRHGIPVLEAWLHGVLPQEGLPGSLADLAANGVVGILAGLSVVAVVALTRRLRPSSKTTAGH